MIVNMLNETEQWTAKVEITSGKSTYKFMYHSCMINTRFKRGENPDSYF